MRTLSLLMLGSSLGLVGAACILLVEPMPLVNIITGLFLSGLGLTLLLDALKPRLPARKWHATAKRQEDINLLFLGYPR